MNSGIIIVWFSPSKEHLNNLDLILEQTKNVVIVDNSQVNNAHFLVDRNVNYISNKNIGGIAGAFNRGFDFFLQDDSIEYIYTFDQDTKIPCDYFVHMESFIRKNKAKIACPSFFDINSKTYGKFVKMSKFSFHETTDQTTHFCISSGMCISKSVYMDLNGFDENLIIDHVDTDFALKAYEKNIDIYVNSDVVLEHAIGEREKRNFLGVTIKPNHHSKVRKYYISRNGTYLAIKYFKLTKSYFILNVFRMIHEYMSVIFYEKDKYSKFRAMNKGILDAVKGNLGSY